MPQEYIPQWQHHGQQLHLSLPPMVRMQLPVLHHPHNPPIKNALTTNALARDCKRQQRNKSSSYLQRTGTYGTETKWQKPPSWPWWAKGYTHRAHIPIVEKNDLSPHSATKTSAKAAATVPAVACKPWAPSAPTPAIANSACTLKDFHHICPHWSIT